MTRLFCSFILVAFVWSLPLRAADTPISVDLALGDVSISKVPFLMAGDHGVYERNGLEVHQYLTPHAVEIASHSGVIVPPEYVREDINSAPLGIVGASPTIYRAVHSGGVDRVALVTHEAIARAHIIGRPEIESAEDFRGKRLGYSSVGTVTHVGLQTFARAMGWTPGVDVELVDQGNTIGAIQSGRVDGAWVTAVVTALAPEAGLSDIVDLADYDLPLAGSSVMAERSWLAENREAARRFVKASVDTVALMKSDRAAFDSTLAKWFNITDTNTLDRIYAEVAAFPDKPYPAAEGIRLMMETYDTPEMRMHAAEDFYDSSFIAELDESGYLDAVSN
jgi:NitT/TauT family transport system substrate-binding protein